MNYISAEEFLKQSEKVQKVLAEWWRPKIGDLYWLFKHMCVVQSESKAKELKGYANEYLLPLLQMHQLIQFIEDKKKCKLSIMPIMLKKNNYRFTFYELVKFVGFEDYCTDENIVVESYNLLEALWQVAIEIAEETQTF